MSFIRTTSFRRCSTDASARPSPSVSRKPPMRQGSHAGNARHPIPSFKHLCFGENKILNTLKHLSAEEVANTITHGFGLVLSVIGFVVLVVLASLRGDGWSIASCVVYGLSLVILYAASTIYHSTGSPILKKRLQIVDHCCIYLLIAGTYTPFGLIIAGNALGRGLLAAIWAFAIIGILVKLVIGDRFPAINVISYLVMGWLGIFAVQPLFNALGLMPVILAF